MSVRLSVIRQGGAKELWQDIGDYPNRCMTDIMMSAHYQAQKTMLPKGTFLIGGPDQRYRFTEVASPEDYQQVVSVVRAEHADARVVSDSMVEAAMAAYREHMDDDCCCVHMIPMRKALEAALLARDAAPPE